jgi:phospholipid/cholesterol/gamma-HCH transport system substrate-binding protein
MGKQRGQLKNGSEEMKREIKIGIFIGIALFILAMFIFIVGDMSVYFRKPGYVLYAYFDTTAGLEKRAVVRIAGVKIGYVKDIRLKRNRAEVEMDIDQDTKIPRDSKASIASLGMVGEKYVEISPGDEEDVYKPGETIEGQPSFGLDRVGNLVLSVGDEIREMSQALKEIIGEEESEASLKDVLQNLFSLTADLKEFFSTSRGDLDQAVESSAKAVQNFDQRVKEISENLDELIHLLKDIAEENREGIKVNLGRIKELINKTEKSFELLNESLEKINKGEGTLGKLIHQPELYKKAERAVDDANRALRPLSRLRVDVGVRADYYPDSDWLKSYLSLALWPDSKKFLLAQIVRDPWLDKFTYSTQGGIRWGDLAPRAGIIESSFGAGVDYYLARDRLKFSLDSFDLNRRPWPHFRFWSHYGLHDYFYLVLGIDDFALASKREIFFGLGLRFR